MLIECKDIDCLTVEWIGIYCFRFCFEQVLLMRYICGILCFAGWLEICRGMLLLAVLLSLTAFVCGVVGLCVHSHCSKRVWFLLAGALLSLVGKCTLYFSVVLCIRSIDIFDAQRIWNVCIIMYSIICRVIFHFLVNVQWILWLVVNFELLNVKIDLTQFFVT